MKDLLVKSYRLHKVHSYIWSDIKKNTHYIGNERVVYDASILDEDGRELEVISPTVAANPISETTSATMRKLLGGVVSDGGGKNAQVDGWSVGGKTGTAQIYKNGRIEKNLHIGSFVGFAPVEDPQVAVLVIVDEAQVKPDYG